LEQDKSDGVRCHKIFFNIRYQVSYDDQDFSKEDLTYPRGQVLAQQHRESLAPEEETLSLLIEEKYLDW